MGRFKIEDIVHLSVRKHADDNFKCPICMCVLVEPAQTSECHHLFCEPCLSSSGVEACPTCREAFPAEGPGWKPLREVSRVVLRQLHALKVYCPHHKEATQEAGADGEDGAGDSAPKSMKRRRVAGRKAKNSSSPAEEPEETNEDEHCDWEGDYGELLSKHLGECRLHAVDCPRGCGAKVVRKSLAAHNETCPKNFKNCEVCGESVRPEHAEQHRREKAELHAQILEKKLAEVEAQNRTLEKKLDESETDARLSRIEKQLSELREATLAPARKVTWVFKTAKVLEQASAAGKWVRSTPFCMLGAGDMHFLLWPRGVDNNDGELALALVGDFEVAGRLQMLADGAVVGVCVWPTPLDISQGRLWSSCLPTVEVFANYVEVKIIFEATEISAVATTEKY